MKINETKYDKNFILNSIKKLGQKYGMDEEGCCNMLCLRTR